MTAWLVYSEPGQGTTVKIYLAADSRLATEIGDKIETLPPTGDETTLLVGDEAAVRRVVVTILERAGYRVLVAENGVEAVRLVRDTDETIALVLLDVVMPELGGPETWERLRELGPDLRVLFSSGYADDRYREWLPKGAEILENPYRVEQLIHRVRGALDG